MRDTICTQAVGRPAEFNVTTVAQDRRQLTFVLPVAVREKRKTLFGKRSWRNRPDEGALVRTRLLMKSFLHYFRQSDLHQFVVIAQEDEVSLLSTVLAALTNDSRYVVISERTICPEISSAVGPYAGFKDGWTIQQLLKIGISRHVLCEFYVTLDSDVICVRPFSYDTLISGDLALTNTETLTDYRRLYRDEFSLVELEIKTQRYRASAELLGYRRPETLANRFYGETPVVLRSRSLTSMMDHIEGRSGRTWSHTLSLNKGWTEYALYFQFLEMTGQLEICCNLAGCNAVLDLERSIWQNSEHYRDPRPYSGQYFLSNASDSDRGVFVAVQSWLPLSSWLPRSYRDLTHFYKDVEKNILGDV